MGLDLVRFHPVTRQCNDPELLSGRSDEDYRVEEQLVKDQNLVSDICSSMIGINPEEKQRLLPTGSSG